MITIKKTNKKGESWQIEANFDLWDWKNYLDSYMRIETEYCDKETGEIFKLGEVGIYINPYIMLEKHQKIMEKRDKYIIKQSVIIIET